MPGIVVSVDVSVGDSVTAGQTLLIVEAMKMQNPITADGDGTVEAIQVAPGQAVAAGDTLLRLDSPSE
ncbi:MAG: acetyl-CoA carboxylase biotin carboxyl carrier protein subunit [Planctomycetes bacterium]|nr:acetyl-CoA carboxylase biotin carboxyl carrier protein subunit [Planctomycetota bacterium]